MRLAAPAFAIALSLFVPSLLPAPLRAPLRAQTATPPRAPAWFAESAQSIPSSDTGWGTITLDAAHDRLFVARQQDGLLVWNIKTRQATTVEDSKGANAAVLAPEAGRAYVAMTDGTVLTVDLATLKPLSRVDLGAGDLNDGVYDPTQNRVHMITGPRPDKTSWITLDARTGSVLSRTEFNSKSMDAPAIAEDGTLFATMRDRNLLQQLDPKDLALVKTWRLGDCVQPSATEWDAAARRVLIACRGDKPVFVALDPAAGVVATVPIGRGVDGLVIDRQRHLVVTANGTDGTMSVIRQDAPNEYALVETIATRPMARSLAIDPASQRLFSVAASFTQPVPGPDGKADGKAPGPVYHPDSFTILTWRPN